MQSYVRTVPSDATRDDPAAAGIERSRGDGSLVSFQPNDVRSVVRVPQARSQSRGDEPTLVGTELGVVNCGVVREHANGFAGGDAPDPSVAVTACRGEEIPGGREGDRIDAVAMAKDMGRAVLPHDDRPAAHRRGRSVRADDAPRAPLRYGEVLEFVPGQPGSRTCSCPLLVLACISSVSAIDVIGAPRSASNSSSG